MASSPSRCCALPGPTAGSSTSTSATAPVLAGDVVVCEATVAEVGTGGFAVEQTIRVGDRVAVAPAGAEVVYFEAT